MARKRTGGRGRAAVFLVVSMVAALAATAVIYNLIRGMQEELAKAQEKEALERIVAAKVPLYQGDTISAESLAYIELPKEFVPDGTFTTIEEAVGRVPLEPILEHELLRVERLAPVDSGVGLNAIIPRGMRAVSINVNDSSGVSGFVVPGNFVDILVTIDDEEQETITRTMLEAARVLAVNNQLGSGPPPEDAPEVRRASVTVAVTPKDAETISLAVSKGEVMLTLRNDVDVETREDTSSVRVATLIGREQIKVENIQASKVAMAKAPPKVRRVKAPVNTAPVICRGGNCK